jgi:hypothetical protein
MAAAEDGEEQGTRKSFEPIHRNLNYNITNSVVPSARFSGLALAQVL